MTPNTPLLSRKIDSLQVEVYPDRARMGQAAAEFVSQAMRRLAEKRSANAQFSNETRMIFAAAPSQNEMLGALVANPELDWSCVRGFHMDEYLGLAADHPASFRNFLQKKLFSQVGITPDKLHLIPGEQTGRPLLACLAYEELLREFPVDILCAGIGENGHLAFNDPPVADFLDPVKIKIVRLDPACRQQQVNDGCFESIQDVPKHAFTLTIPALLAAPVACIVVPGPLKRDAVRGALFGPIDESNPASALRRHPGARLFLDQDSGADLRL
ncbi:MAG: glucosamine-6-phosphate deaminase [Planctomycetota bacterium]|nr:glucosamine-6-phosphate deaminase [Planctomycetota bacterium]